MNKAVVKRYKTTPILFLLLSLFGIGLKADTAIKENVPPVERKINPTTNGLSLDSHEAFLDSVKRSLDREWLANCNQVYCLKVRGIKMLAFSLGILVPWYQCSAIKKTTLLYLSLLCLIVLSLAKTCRSYEPKKRPQEDATGGYLGRLRFLQTIPQNDFPKEVARLHHLKMVASDLEKTILDLDQKRVHKKIMEVFICFSGFVSLFAFMLPLPLPLVFHEPPTG